MSTDKKHIVLCNNASLPKRLKKKKDNLLKLFYEGDAKNVDIRLPNFIKSQYHLNNRLRDLLEISSSIFLADRKVPRGTNSDLEFQSWSRKFHFIIKVRDHMFWNRPEIKKSLCKVLSFMTGDYSYDFTFQEGRATTPTNLFDTEEYDTTINTPTKVILFSGGLDSFAGAVEMLEKTNDKVYLVSHNSGNPSTAKTQRIVYEKINQLYPNRTQHFKFKCSMSGSRAPDETQRTRSFLYSSIAYAIASNIGNNCLFFFENGITSLNFPKRADMINARASRTTHPKTIKLLSEFFTLLNDTTSFKVKHPYIFKTKTDVISKLKDLNKEELVNSTVSCSKVFKTTENHTHCGTCSQCVDRRFAMYSSEMEGNDGDGIYSINFINDSIEDGGDKTTIIDYVRQAIRFKKHNEASFYDEMADQLVDVIDFIEGGEEEVFNSIYALCKRHGEQIYNATSKMRQKHDDIGSIIERNSFLDIIKERSFLKPPILLLVNEICNKLGRSIPISFQKNLPKNENDLNDKINGLISSEKAEYEREFPSISFALAKTIPDHSLNGAALLIETKFVRDKTTPSVITEGIAADLTKYPDDCHKLFVIYDPQRKIYDDLKFKKGFENKGNCTIYIVR